jgi:hypothetical protein
VEPGRTIPAHDLAVLSLGAAVPAEVATPLAVLVSPPTERDEEGWWRNRRVRLVGWGRRPEFIGQASRRAGWNAVSRVENGIVVTVPEAEDAFRSRTGWSGGPALVRLGGQEHVVGILFGGERADSRDSIFAATFEPLNAGWLARVAGGACEDHAAAPIAARSRLTE